MLGQGITPESRVNEGHEKWFSGSLDELAAQVTNEELAHINEYQAANAAYPRTLMNNPVPLDIVETKPDLVKVLTHNVVRATKEQRAAIKQDQVIKSLKHAKEEGHNPDMVRDAMGARRAVIMIGMARAALPEMIAPPAFDNPGAIVVTRTSVEQP